MSHKNKKQKRGSFKKTPNQTRDYKQFIAKSTYSPDSTVPEANLMLYGTDEISGNPEAEIESAAPVKNTPFKYRFCDWVKEHIFPTIITTVVIAIVTALITQKVQMAVVEQKIEYLDKQIEMISIETVDRELLEAKLDLIKEEMNSSSIISLNDIKWQIKNLEEKITSIQQDESN